MNALDETTLVSLAPFTGKITPPRLPVDAMPRERLLRVVHERGARVLLVSAPVGFGKSTLLAQLHGNFVAKGFPAAWLTLDERDNDLGHFLLYLREAAIQLRCTEVPPLSITPTSREVRAVVERQSQDLIDAFARQTQPCLLVLDDFEKVTEPAVIALVQALGVQFCHGQCLAIGSRTEPALTLATWRSQGRLHQIAAAALRFETGETNVFLQRQVRLNLGPEQRRLLHDRTDGWPGIVRLAALALEGVGNPAQWLLTLTGGSGDITDYLVENVLAQQSAERRDFLIGTSVMEVFDAAACDHVLQRSNSQDQLCAISHANLFLTEIDAQGQWVRYH
jgi:LuxR family maltose regulon positive regulatory protein